MSLQAIWFEKAKSEEEKEAIQRDFDAALRAFERLEEILRRKIKEGSSEKDYENPSWAFLQADRIGYNRAIKEVISLITRKELTNDRK